jgi:outer membrane protein assembly factor BamB
VPSVLPTISCRFIAPVTLSIAVVGTLSPAAAQAPAEPAVASAARVPATLRATVPLAAPAAFGPLVADADAMVYVPLRSGVVTAHRASDGAEAWRVELAADQPLAVHPGLVLVAAGEAVHALRAADGSIAWRAPTGTLAAPLLSQDGWVIVLTSTEMMALRVEDGAVAWKIPGGPPAARASLEGTRVYVPLADGSLRAIDLASGAERWTRRLGGAPTEALAVADRVYVGAADKYFYCLDADDGDVAWRFPVRVALHGRPAADRERVFAGALDNMVRAFDRGSGARRWNKGVPFRPMAGPIVIGTTVLVPGPAAAIPAFDAATGTAQATLALGGPLAEGLAVGTSGGETLLAAVIGDISRGWSLVIFDSSFSLTAIPLTSLPGEAVPIVLPYR